MHKDRKNAIQHIINYTNQQQVRESIIFLVNDYWQVGNGSFLQKSYDLLKANRSDLVPFFGWLITHCSLWNVIERRNKAKIKTNKNKSTDKAKENWVRVKSIIDTHDGHYSSIQYREIPVHDINSLLGLYTQTGTSKHVEKKLNELDIARNVVRETKSAKAATNAAIIAINQYIQSHSSVSGENISNLFDLFKVTYESSIHEQFYKLVANTTNWDIAQRKPIISKESNLSRWKSVRKELMKSEYGLADYTVSRAPQPSQTKHQQSISSLIQRLADLNLMISASIYSSILTAKEEEFNKLKRMVDEIQDELERAKDIRQINR